MVRSAGYSKLRTPARVAGVRTGQVEGRARPVVVAQRRPRRGLLARGVEEANRLHRERRRFEARHRRRAPVERGDEREPVALVAEHELLAVVALVVPEVERHALLLQEPHHELQVALPVLDAVLARRERAPQLPGHERPRVEAVALEHLHHHVDRRDVLEDARVAPVRQPVERGNEHHPGERAAVGDPEARHPPHLAVAPRDKLAPREGHRAARPEELVGRGREVVVGEVEGQLIGLGERLPQRQAVHPPRGGYAPGQEVVLHLGERPLGVEGGRRSLGS